MTLPFDNPTRVLFFTGKGGVGKTSTASATAIGLADAGKRVLLVSTDPASNLDEVLGVPLSSAPTAVPMVPRLSAMNVDPLEAAKRYRESVVGPYRGVLPEATVASIEEQLSGACTVEIAAFDEFSKLLGNAAATVDFDHVIFDTAPTGHTLRLLELPAAWTNFIESNVGGTSCLGPLSGLGGQKELYAASNRALRSAEKTTMVLVARADQVSIKEAERTRIELSELGVANLILVLNGVFLAADKQDALAQAFERRGKEALATLPAGLASLRHFEVELLPFGLVGIDALRRFFQRDGAIATVPSLTEAGTPASDTVSLDSLIDSIARRSRGVVMTMGKGGVGKTTVAARMATALANRGHRVVLTTTDPAAHISDAATERPCRLTVTRIDPELETRRYRDEVLATAGKELDAQGRALLEEDLRSPCTEEIAVFRAFATAVALGENGFVVIDTAPTGHTLLLLDATEAYHREVLRKAGKSPEAVQKLLPRLRDPSFTSVILVTLPEATPIHEAMQLEQDLARAGIKPTAWLANQCLTTLTVTDPILRARQAQEAPFIRELSRQTAPLALEVWSDGTIGKAHAG